MAEGFLFYSALSDLNFGVYNESHSKSCGFHIVDKLKHRNGEMGAAVISKKINRNFWFFFLSFITAGNES